MLLRAPSVARGYLTVFANFFIDGVTQCLQEQKKEKEQEQKITVATALYEYRGDRWGKIHFLRTIDQYMPYDTHGHMD